MKLPGSFADQVYVLREHIQFVRNRLLQTAAALHYSRTSQRP